ncbi:MAG: tetratricopeptide repeat protein [Candidatus Eisenbacteria bacterium]|uniref:Tetratricopeptide repeat protein n=1 Tax=Eiseniibacteriota bacterium TaxID=2212470 RepID=A0A948W4S9_UNCEI|nr:tetratricopeptide repeat protein [Candidatus Eisenbacteria bacterium]MBU1948201.1 tetratricopeptide repeat protein [Candidatus Eisenbacteria bacterium]MBU2689664.1 tetratricopeptide repeat protein [Candidatus Eisenbacteria bacterium]
MKLMTAGWTFLLLFSIAGWTAAEAQSEVFSTEEICRKNFQTAMEYKKNLKYQDAEEFFTLVVETCPDHIDAYLNLGHVLTQLKKYPDAIDIYQRALEVEPRNLSIKEALAYTYGASGDLEKSIRLYQDILDLDPERHGIYKNLAYLYERQGSWPEALMMAKMVLSVDPSDIVGLQQAARTALDKKLYLEAMNLYEMLYAKQPEDISIQRILGYFYFQVQLSEKAIPIYRAVLEAEPESPSSLFEHKILALCLKKAGLAMEAAEEYEYITEHEPEKLENFYNLALMYNDSKAYDKALNVVERGLRQDPSYQCLYYASGKVYESKAKDAKAAERYDEAVGFFRDAITQFEKCVNGSFCARQCSSEIERMEQFVTITNKEKQKKELEAPSSSAG